MQQAVFLDRDNTIIDNDGDLGDPSQVELLEGAADSMARLHDAGFQLIVVTNQSGIARGVFTEADVLAVHDTLESRLAEATGLDGLVLGWYFSPWHPEGVVDKYRGDHPSRKPGPGMLLQAATDHGLDLAVSWMVGDQERDVEAGLAAGCRSILLSSDTGASTAAEHVCRSLVEATDCILGSEPAA